MVVAIEEEAQKARLIIQQVAEKASKPGRVIGAARGAVIRPPTDEVKEWKAEELAGVATWEQEAKRDVRSVEQEFAPYKEDGGYNIAGMLEAGYTSSRLAELGFDDSDVQMVEKTQETLAPYRRDGKYDLAGMMEAGFSSTELEDLGFSGDDVRQTQADIARMGKIETTLSPYLKGDKYDLTKAIEGGVTAGWLEDAGFTKEDISSAKDAIIISDIQSRLSPYMEKVAPAVGIRITASYTANIGKALKDGTVTRDELHLLGYSESETKQAKARADIAWWAPYVPVYGTIKTWGAAGTVERGLSILGDLATIVPVIGWLGKAGMVGARATALTATSLRASAVTSRAAALRALTMGSRAEAAQLFKDAALYETRALRLTSPTLLGRARTLGKSTLYAGETVVTAPLQIGKGLITAPRATVSGMWGVTTFPFAHPIQTVKGIGALATGRVGLGEPLIFQTARNIFPSRAFPLRTWSAEAGTAIPRAPGGSSQESMWGARQAVAGLEAGARKPFWVSSPGLRPFEVRPSIAQRWFGARLYHASPSAAAYSGGHLQISPEGLFTSPYFGEKWALTSSRGIVGARPGAFVFPPEVPPMSYRFPATLKAGQVTGPFRPLYGGTEFEVGFGPKSWITVGAKPEYLTRVSGQLVKMYPSVRGFVPTETVLPSKITLSRMYGARLRTGWETIRHPFGGRAIRLETEKMFTTGTAHYAAEWEGKLSGDVFTKAGNIVKTAPGFQHAQGGLVRRRVTAVVIDNEGRILLGSDKVEPKGYFDLPGGRIDPKGKFGRLLGQEGISIEGSAHGQIKSEFGFGIKNTQRLPVYSGRVNRHSLPGSYVVKAEPKSTVIDRLKYTPKGQPAELKDAMWWDGKTVIRVSPATKDILAGLNKEGVIKVDMSKVRIHSKTPKELLWKGSRDQKWGSKLGSTKTVMKTRKMTFAEVEKVTAEMSPAEAEQTLTLYKGYISSEARASFVAGGVPFRPYAKGLSRAGAPPLTPSGVTYAPTLRVPRVVSPKTPMGYISPSRISAYSGIAPSLSPPTIVRPTFTAPRIVGGRIMSGGYQAGGITPSRGPVGLDRFATQLGRLPVSIPRVPRYLRSRLFTPYGGRKKYTRPPLPLLPPRDTGEGKREGRLPRGTITWRQGFIRKVIRPPYGDVKPTSTYERGGSGVPEDTIRIVGGPAPITAEVDLGVVDIRVEGKREEISFMKGGLKTDVGKRHPSKTKGMSVKARPATFKRMMV